MIASQIRVLLIEDNPDDAVLMRRLLSVAMKISFTLEHADRLIKGLQLLTAGGFDLVLLDLDLPDGHGLSTFEKVHALAPDVAVIVMTGNDDDEIAITAVQKGAQDYLIKGQVAAAVLGRAVRYAIERQKLLGQIERSAREIKVLRGFLPICANCKKIRDDKGYWTQIEAYISAHSDAEFSHGLCPECVMKIYPGYRNK